MNRSPSRTPTARPIATDLAVDLRCATARGRRFAAQTKKDAAAVMRELHLEDRDLSLMLVSDSSMRQMNREWRHIDKPTDVLSFPQHELANYKSLSIRPGLPLGDVVISVETALRQARDAGIAPALRIRDLLIHGVLHLLGYDHERSRAEARRMFALSRRLAATIEHGTSKTRR